MATVAVRLRRGRTNTATFALDVIMNHGLESRLGYAAFSLVILAVHFAGSLLKADSLIDLGRGPVTVHVPTSYDPQSQAPLAILLHGYGSNGTQTEGFFGFANLSEANGLIYAAPDGTVDSAGRPFWNATDACCNSDGSTVDDSAYLRLLVEAIQAEYNIDPERIYFAGLSNGGFMSYRMACDHSDMIAAIVSVAGATFNDPSECTPTQPVHLLQIHGTADNVIQFSGGTRFGAAYPGAVQSVETWAAYNGCSLTASYPPETYDFDANLAGSETTVRRYPFACLSGGSAELRVVNGGRHVLSPTPDFGPAVLDFMLTHPKPAPIQVPTVSTWGVVAMLILILVLATLKLRQVCRLQVCVLA